MEGGVVTLLLSLISINDFLNYLLLNNYENGYRQKQTFE
jgi:hypothetical protein